MPEPTSDENPPGFFTDHPRFLETSTTSTGVRRLNMRHEALIDANRDILQGARVLDIASHDGRWMMAALKAGAAHVTGIEARPELVENAEKTFAEYGADSSSCRFITGDLYGVLAREDLQIDVIQCFGFLYHTLRFTELFSRLSAMQPRHLVLDTRVLNQEGQLIKVFRNEVTRQAHAAAEEFAADTTVLVGWPTPSALRMMLRVYGFTVDSEYDWQNASTPEGGNLVSRYRSGGRITWRCSWSADDMGGASGSGDDAEAQADAD
ncbi:MAG: class I SAM-dependent methyltransferase [Actinomycetota bacterium]|nr:class I SAM-dependent methyltransferase [Actinomycetota bacterium]